MVIIFHFLLTSLLIGLTHESQGVSERSGTTMISIRRLEARPFGVSLEATGWMGPKLAALICFVHSTFNHLF